MFPVNDGANTDYSIAADAQVIVYAGSRWACRRCDVLCNSRHRPVCWAGCGQPMDPAHLFRSPAFPPSVPRHLQEI